MNWDLAYQQLIREVASRGESVPSGATVGGEPISTRSLSGMSVSADMADGFPLLQLRRISWRTVVLETCFFLRGLTNSRWLEERGCRIWKKWSADNGGLGPIYGAQWRRWPSPMGGFIDQLRDAIDALCSCMADATDRTRRRIIVQAWNPGANGVMALPPCHTSWQLLPRPGGRVDMMVNLRSCDLVVGLPHNMASYALILHVMCEIAGATPGKVTAFLGDAHIYDNQMDAAYAMAGRFDNPSPSILTFDGAFRSIEDVDSWDPADDFRVSLVGYDAHPPLNVGEIAL